MACVGCEGKPAPENNPCAVCGLTAPSNANTSWLDLVEHLELALVIANTSIRDQERRATAAEARNAEVSMLAHRWMEAHDSLKAGLDYDLPTPADLPNEKARADRLEKALERIAHEKGISAVGLARAALQQETQK